jgi:hypothetical protein
MLTWEAIHTLLRSATVPNITHLYPTIVGVWPGDEEREEIEKGTTFSGAE